MKINILTWLYNGNYGTVLQAYALQKYLLNQGFECVDINYKPSNKTKFKNWITNRNSIALFYEKYENRKNLKKSGKSQLFMQRDIKFEDFRKKYIKLTQEYSNPRELSGIENKECVFICGSDQIWSPKLMNPVYYFSFLPKQSYRISYATSFGVMNTSKRKKKMIAKFLGEFSSVSLREETGVEFVKSITDIDVALNVDPTFLLKKTEWEDICENSRINRDYILCFLLTPNMAYINKIKEFANIHKLLIVNVPNAKGPFNVGGQELIDVSPLQWLGLIKDANYIFTDSYHGTIFSIIFHKEFYLFKRFSDKSKISENSRIYSLCKKLHLENRIYGKENMNEVMREEPIDYEIVEDLNRQSISKSQEWLIDCINFSEGRNNEGCNN